MIVSEKAGRFSESVIRAMTQVCLRYNGINLAQGFPDFSTPPELQEAACRAIRDGYNQYARTWGTPNLVAALGEKLNRFNRIQIDPDMQVTVTCGTTEAMIAALMATVNPGEEVIVFSPFYENYGADTILCGAIPRYVHLHLNEENDFELDPDELADAFSDKTRAIIINTPHNPAGKVFTREEMVLIAELCKKHDALAITDEIYEHILYDGREHVSIATLPGMADRTITISGLSKTYSVTGWRVAWAVASPKITGAIRKVHDFLTVGAPHPFQEAGAVALRMPPSFYEQLARDYARRREMLLTALDEAGLHGVEPEGSYYTLVDVSGFARPDEDDTQFAMRLVQEAGVATVPGSSFYDPPALGKKFIRFAFCKKDETLQAAGQRLMKWSSQRRR